METGRLISSKSNSRMSRNVSIQDQADSVVEQLMMKRVDYRSLNGISWLDGISPDSKDFWVCSTTSSSYRDWKLPQGHEIYYQKSLHPKCGARANQLIREKIVSRANGERVSDKHFTYYVQIVERRQLYCCKVYCVKEEKDYFTLILANDEMLPLYRS